MSPEGVMPEEIMKAVGADEMTPTDPEAQPKDPDVAANEDLLK